jgi:hypothetical protein
MAGINFISEEEYSKPLTFKNNDAIHSVSKSVATDYAKFCVRCDRENLPLLCLEDYIKQYCC